MSEAASLTEYDCVVLGSPLTAGSIRKEVGAENWAENG